MTLSVLIVDDDRRLFELLAEYLGQSDVKASHAQSGEEALRQLPAGAFDAVILDIMMPGMDGLSVLRKIRENSAIPILMLTAKGDETDRVVGLELGADDYMTKPFSPRELLARIRAVLRRGSNGELGSRLKVGRIELHQEGREVLVEGERVDLTGLEFDLLCVLMTRAGRVVSRQSLLEQSGRADTIVGDRAVDVHISHLRRKLRSASGPKNIIQTVRGVGYLMSKEGT